MGEETADRFRTHEMDGDQHDIAMELRHRFRALALFIADVCSESRERDSALDHLDDGLSDCVKAIARRGLRFPNFYFKGTNLSLSVTSRRMLKLSASKLAEYNRRTDCWGMEYLLDGKQNPSADYPSFGYHPEHTGPQTLGEWLKERGVEL